MIVCGSAAHYVHLPLCTVFTQSVGFSYAVINDHTRVKSTMSGLGPMYSRSEYCTQYSIWCTNSMSEASRHAV